MMNVFKSYFTPATKDGEPAQANSPSTGTDIKLGKRTSQRQSKKSTSSHEAPSIEISPALHRDHSRSESQPSSLLSPPTPGAHGNRVSQNASVAGEKRSRPSSLRTSSIFPMVDMRGSTVSLVDIKNDMMVKWLYEQQLRKLYVSGQDAFEGAVLKKGRGNFTCCPPQMSLIPNSLYEMVTHMNVRCAMTVNTPVVRAILGSIRRTDADIDFVPLPEGLRVQIIRTMADLPRCKLHHFAAFVEDIGMLVVWDDEAEKLLQRASYLEAQLVLMIWGDGQDDGDETPMEKRPGYDNVAEIDPAQLEEALSREHRPVMLWSASMIMVTLALCLACIGLGWRALVLEIMVDGNYMRLALLAVSPLQFFVSLVSHPIPIVMFKLNHG
jgi:hypothetical protein